MSLSPGQLRLGRVHCAWQPYRRGEPAEPRVRAWLAAELGALPAHGLALRRDAFGRPRFAAATHRYDLNWSHSGEGLLMALAEDAHVGCDLEWLRPRPRALEVAQRYFHADEALWLAALPPARREAAFVRLWCAKEAVLKAHGRGIAFGLHRLRIADDDSGLRVLDCDPALGRPGDWRLHAFAPAPGYLATLAWAAAGADAPHLPA